MHKERAGPWARLFHVKNPGFPGFFRYFWRFSTWLPERFFLKSVSCRMSLTFRFFSWKGILMNKNELVSAVADAASISKGDAQSAVDAVFSVITGELKKGGDVRLVGFGNFTVSKRAASTGRNPQTGAEVKIPARTVPKFSAGKGLKDAVN
jgi:nucleoid DNA-binding protein